MPSERAQEVFAWAVREATTNVLRHSEARTCSIALRDEDGGAWLEVCNDGVRGTSGPGTGLAGLAMRAEAVSGSVRAEAVGNGKFPAPGLGSRRWSADPGTQKQRQRISPC